MRTFGQEQNQQAPANLARSNKATSGLNHSPLLLQLQRTIGNQALQGLLHENTERFEVAPSTLATTRFGHEFSRIPVYATPPVKVQRKLTVNTPGDLFEREADRIADEVMRVPARPEQGAAVMALEGRRTLERRCVGPVGSNGSAPHMGGSIRTEAGSIQTRLVQQVQDPSGGEALPVPVRQRIEKVIQADLSEVRVHHDGSAKEASASLNARAFTHGKHIWLGEGQSPADLRLMAHEAAHVVQQQESPQQTPEVQRDIVSMTIRGEGESEMTKRDSAAWYQALGDDFGAIQKSRLLGFQGGFKTLPWMVIGWQDYALGLWKVETATEVDSVEGKEGKQEFVDFKAKLSNLNAYVEKPDGSRESELDMPKQVADGPSGYNFKMESNVIYTYDAPRWGGVARKGKTYFIKGDWALKASHRASTWQGDYRLDFGLGRGGFGEVYFAVSDGGKEVALKLLRGHTDAELRGVSHCLNLKHPNLVHLYDLRTDVSEDQSFLKTLELFVDRVRDRSGLEITLRTVERVRLPVPQEREVFRIAQEAIVNVERHAEARHATISWTCDPSGARLDIADDGRGFPIGRAGRLDSYGLLGMRERAASVGATLVV
jgi:hypothetical protein